MNYFLGIDPLSSLKVYQQNAILAASFNQPKDRRQLMVSIVKLFSIHAGILSDEERMNPRA